MHKQPWIYNKWFDSIFILLPPFACVLAVVLFPGYFLNNPVSLFWWFSLVLCVDVAHVYSTIYRTYADKETLSRHKTFFITLPVVLFVTCVLVYQAGAIYFWRLLAYIAVFHFIRQQYGFLRIYDRQMQQARRERLIDMLAIYSATLYPLIFWHLSGDRNFHWFIEHDFIDLAGGQFLLPYFGIIYALIIVTYLVKETRRLIVYRRLNIPRNLVVFGTVLSWYVGIVLFNGDLVFTLLNIISHGVPYMALVWIYGRKKRNMQGSGAGFRIIFSKRFIIIFILSVISLAYFEEALWDLLVWKEHRSIFPAIQVPFRLSEQIIVPLLAVPQLTHYVIDGFIWKLKKDRFSWKATILPD